MTIPDTGTNLSPSSEVPDFHSDVFGGVADPQTLGPQSSLGGVELSAHSGLQANFGVGSISLNDEATQSLIETLFSNENLGKILKYALPIAVAAIIAKIAKDYWNR